MRDIAMVNCAVHSACCTSRCNAAAESCCALGCCAWYGCDCGCHYGGCAGCGGGCGGDGKGIQWMRRVGAGLVRVH